MPASFQRDVRWLMFNFWTIMYLLFVGIVAGFVARLLVPGRDAMGFWQTVLLGLVGSFAGGFLAWGLFGWDEDEGALQPGGVIFSILGAILVLLVWRVVDRRRSVAS
ncbi:MAG TPA: GlsB/YeaQ/YmgE family stress response membrane protein [Acidimicrobiales bacterium]|nr:GlsB/YeaQ/YmgE family stress response membrane protein [Acidimicrobiales bacterium]